MTSKDFYLRFYPLHFCPILMFEKEPEFPFFMLRAKQGNHRYHFYNVFGMTRPWLGIEPGTSRTRNQQSTTRLSRRPSKRSDIEGKIWNKNTTAKQTTQQLTSHKYIQSGKFKWTILKGCRHFWSDIHN